MRKLRSRVRVCAKMFWGLWAHNLAIGKMGNDEGQAKLAGQGDKVEEPFRGWVNLGQSSEGQERESELLRAK